MGLSTPTVLATVIEGGRRSGIVVPAGGDQRRAGGGGISQKLDGVREIDRRCARMGELIRAADVSRQLHRLPENQLLADKAAERAAERVVPRQ